MTQEARVIQSTGSWYQLKNKLGQVFNARLKGVFRTRQLQFTNPIAVGDFVLYETTGKDDHIIVDILPRQNYLIRQATHFKNKHHIIASNIDFAILLFTIKTPKCSLAFLDKTLVACESHHIEPIIFFNKADLLNSQELQELQELQKRYYQIGYVAHITSIKQEPNQIDKIFDSIVNKTVLVFGYSGTGKSSLLNLYNPSLDLKTQYLSTYSQKGMHTTSFAHLYSSDKYLFECIDTPGIKEFDIVNISKQNLSHCFKEFEAFHNTCHFNNCTHINEPNCAIKKQVENGTIHPLRYEQYLHISNTCLKD